MKHPQNFRNMPLMNTLLRRAAGVLAPWFAIVATLVAIAPAFAGFPEPYNLIFGHIELGGQPIGAANILVSVEARRFPTAGVIARYRMGSQASAGDFYALKISLETVAPVSDQGVIASPGTLLYITVVSNGVAMDQLEYVMGERGTTKRLDFGSIDSDGDGLPDGWEQAYLLGLQSGPNDDPDHDGLVNRDEFRLGTNPMKMDAPHPADIAQRDGRITISELSAYYGAWKAGKPWTVAPTNIPIEYVTRASAIWEAGEYYRLDGSIDAPPLWWVSTTPPTNAGPSSIAGTSGTRTDAGAGLQGGGETEPPLSVESVLPPVFLPQVTAMVVYRVTVQPGLRTYAVEDYPPVGWRIDTISPGGSYDPKNGKLKWGPFFDRQPRELSYTVTPDRVGAEQVFTGVGSYDGHLVPMYGRRSVVAGSDVGTVVRLELSDSIHQWMLFGQPGMGYAVQYSENLVDWKPLTNGTADGQGRFIFHPVDSSLPQSFFRARSATGTPGGTQ